MARQLLSHLLYVHFEGQEPVLSDIKINNCVTNLLYFTIRLASRSFDFIPCLDACGLRGGLILPVSVVTYNQTVSEILMIKFEKRY